MILRRKANRECDTFTTKNSPASVTAHYHLVNELLLKTNGPSLSDACWKVFGQDS